MPPWADRGRDRRAATDLIDRRSRTDEPWGLQPLGLHVSQEHRPNEHGERNQDSQKRQGKRLVACKPHDQGHGRRRCEEGAQAGHPATPRALGTGQRAHHRKSEQERQAGRLDQHRQRSDDGKHGRECTQPDDCPVRHPGPVSVIERSRQLPVRSDLVCETRGGEQRRVDCRTGRERRGDPHGHQSGRTERLPTGDGQCDFLVFDDLIGPDQHRRAKRYDDVDDRDDHDRREHGAGERLIRRGDVVAVIGKQLKALVGHEYRGSAAPMPASGTP